jgi:hypothetical protein
MTSGLTALKYGVSETYSPITAPTAARPLEARAQARPATHRWPALYVGAHRWLGSIGPFACCCAASSQAEVSQQKKPACQISIGHANAAHLSS